MTEEVPEYDENWQIPDYLKHMYGLWQGLSDAWRTFDAAHQGIHTAVEGYEDEGKLYPPDGVMRAFSETFVIDINMTVTALVEHINTSLAILLNAFVTYMEEMAALPPWWTGEVLCDNGSSMEDEDE